MGSLRIIVGPETMLVERHGVRSPARRIGVSEGPAEIRMIAADLWQTIRAPVSWKVWVRHRLRVATYRQQAARTLNHHPGPWFPGPRPDLIALRPWAEVRDREWRSVPPGVGARVLRASPVNKETGHDD